MRPFLLLLIFLMLLGCTRMESTGQLSTSATQEDGPGSGANMRWINALYATDGATIWYYPDSNATNRSYIVNHILTRMPMTESNAILGHPDIATLTSVDAQLVKDRTTLYFIGAIDSTTESDGSELVWLPLDADAATFSLFGAPDNRYGVQVYGIGGYRFGRDKDHVYFITGHVSHGNDGFERIPADPATFQLENGTPYVASDRNCKYRLETYAMFQTVQCEPRTT